MNPLLRVWVRRLIPVLLLGLAAGLFLVNRTYVSMAPARNAFVARWEGGRAWIRESRSPYDPEVSLRAQEQVYGRPANLRRGEDPHHFLYPLPALAIFGPLGLLDQDSAHAVWVSLVGMSLLLSSVLWIRALRWRPSAWMITLLMAFSVTWFPGFATLVDSQPAAVIGLILAGGLVAVEARREALAGLLLAGSLVKPQLSVGLVVFVAVWSVASARPILLGWLTLGVVVLFGGSLLVVPGWPLAMARQVFDYLAGPSVPSAVGRLSEALGVGPPGTLVLTLLLIAYLLWEWRQTLRADRRRFLWGAALTQTVVLLVAPFSSLANLTTMVFPLAAVLEAWYARQGRAIDPAATFALAMLAAGTWAVSLPTLEGAQPPLSILVGLPLLGLIGLIWVRWWSIRGRVWSELGSLGT